jgi:5,10-methylenetetrahydrofolate reductase
LPIWKREADFLFVQVSFSVQSLLRWRDEVDFDGPVFAGVLVPSSPAMARKLTAAVPQLAVPQALIDALELDVDAGVDFACDMVATIQESGAFDGVHLVPVSRYRDVAARLEGMRSLAAPTMMPPSGRLDGDSGLLH